MDRPKIPTVKDPTESDKLYFRLMFHEFFFGPFDSKKDVSMALAELDAWDEMWDYDGFCIIRGLSPLPKDYVFGFPFVSKEERNEIEIGRKQYANNQINRTQKDAPVI